MQLNITLRLLFICQLLCCCSLNSITTVAATAVSRLTNFINSTATVIGSSYAPLKLMSSKSASQRMRIISIYTNCTRELFEIHIALSRQFYGDLYAQDFPFECVAHGTAEKNIALRVLNSGCGVRAESMRNGRMQLSLRIMLQMMPKLRQSSDMLRTVQCQLSAEAMGMSVAGSNRNSRMMTLPQQQPLLEQVPRVRIWLELTGPDGNGVVQVGQATTLLVRAIVPLAMDVRVIDCAALDGLGESTQQLLNEHGCPIDEQVMPALHVSMRPAEVGWSKLMADDLIAQTFTSTFAAFKFPDRERLHVTCGVQLCKGKCAVFNCHSKQTLNSSNDEQLARIEVFNSLAVTAPQIEMERQQYNATAEKQRIDRQRTLLNDGTLCLSLSKLALSFCALGFIFLAAIIVALASLMRRRNQTVNTAPLASSHTSSNESRFYRAAVAASMFSNSSESAQSIHFASKKQLLMPTLHCGRMF